MNRQKVVMVLLVVAILFSVGSIWLSLSADSDGLVPVNTNTNTITTIESDSGNLGINVLPPPSGGSA